MVSVGADDIIKLKLVMNVKTPCHDLSFIKRRRDRLFSQRAHGQGREGSPEPVIQVLPHHIGRPWDGVVQAGRSTAFFLEECWQHNLFKKSLGGWYIATACREGR